MIVAISGKAGSGKSTVAKKVARELGLEHYSIGDLMRQMAGERGMTLFELSREAEKDNSIDRELDRKQMELRDKDNFVIDGRLTAYFIPNAALKVFLDCDDKVRAGRIMKEKRQDEKSDDINDVIKKLNDRESSERKRYKEYYDVDYHDKKLYDLVIDTSNLKIGEVVGKVLEGVKQKTSG